MAYTQLQLLEEFILQHHGKPRQVPPGIQRLIAFLALRGPTHRCVVAGTLWPEVAEDQALASLRTSIWRMAGIIPDVILTEGMRLSLPATLSVDSRDQEQFVKCLLRSHEKDEDWILAGLDHLWGGELLPGWYDDWVVFERERLMQLRLHALEDAAAVLTRCGRLDSALQLALEAVRTEPLRETATAVLIAVYLAEGNISDALHRYDAFRELLRCELDLEPSPALGKLLPERDFPVTPP